MKIKSNYVVPAVASAVALACGSAGAATLASTSQLRVTNQYIDSQAATSSAVVFLPAMSFTTTDNSYAADSLVRVTIAGASITTASAVTGGGGAAGVIACKQGGGTTNMTLTYSSVANNVITFTVARNGSDATSATSSVTCSLDASKISVLVNSIAKNSTVTADWSGVYASGTTFDRLADAGSASGVGANIIGRTFDQFAALTSTTRDVINPSITVGSTAKSAPFARTVNASATTRFAGSTTDAYSTLNAKDLYVFTSRDEGNSNTAGAAGITTNVNYSATGTTRSVALTGNFAFLDDDANGCAASDLTSGPGKLYESNSSTITPTITVAADCSRVTYAYAGVSTADLTTTLMFAVEGATSDGATSVSTSTVRSRAGLAIPTGVAFQATTSILNGTDTVGTVSSGATSWTRSDAATATTVNIPYLPYGTGISRIVYATNKSSTQSLVASFAGQKEDGTICSSSNFGTVSVPVGGVTLLTAAIDAGLAACGVTASTTAKAQVTVTFTPSTGSLTSTGNTGSVVVTANYNVNGDRVNVLNSSN